MTSEISPRTKQVLRVISQLSKPTMREIALGMDDDQSVTYNVVGLQRAGYVEAATKSDVRTYWCTERGLRLLRSMDSGSSQIAGPRVYVASAETDPYRPKPWNPSAARPGAMDHVQMPSMFMGQRTFRRDAA